MRPLLPTVFLLICTGCHVRAPVPPGTRASGHAEVRIDVRTRVRVRAEPHYEPPPPPQAPPEPVPLEGAPVVEFFGVPLEDAQDVVFLLDRSGSMTERAEGRIAVLTAPPSTPASTKGASTEDSPPVTPPAVVAPGNDPPAEPYDGHVDAPAEPYDAPAHAAAEPHDPLAHPSAEDAMQDTVDDPADGPATPHGPPLPTDDPPMDAPTTSQDEPTVGTTAPRKIDVARRELIEALAQLPAGTRLNVLFFSDWLETYAPGLFSLEESQRENLIGFVEGTEPTGATALATAMRAAFTMGARHVVLLSDGRGNRGGDSESILRDAREAMRGGVRIDTIGIGPDQDRPLLRTLAEESGGLYQAF